MKKILLLFTVLILGKATLNAGPSYDYFALNTQAGGFDGDPCIQGNQGLGISGRIGKNMFGVLEIGTGEITQNDNDVNTCFSAGENSSTTKLGLGFIMDISENTTFDIGLGITSVDYDNAFDVDGTGFELAVRTMIGSMQAGIGMSSGTNDYANGISDDVDSTWLEIIFNIQRLGIEIEFGNISSDLSGDGGYFGLNFRVNR